MPMQFTGKYVSLTTFRRDGTLSLDARLVRLRKREPAGGDR